MRESTSRSASAYCAFSAGESCPSRAAGRALRPVATAQANSRCLTALPSCPRASARAWIFSNTRGTDGKWVGRAAATSSTSLRESPLQNASVPPISSDTICTTRASACASGRNMNSVAGGRRWTRSMYASIVKSTLRWVSMQPLGGPVVPDV